MTRTITRLTLLAILFAVPSLAHAQGVGFVAGGTIDPEQFYAGTFFESPGIGGGSIHVRPGVDGSWGQGVRIAWINIDIIHRGDIGSGWQFYTGGGPTVLITRVSDSVPATRATTNDVTGGFAALFGFASPNGFIAELKFGRGLEGSSLKFGVGYKVGKKS